MLAIVLGVQHVKSNQRESVTPDVEEVGESDGYITTKKFKDSDKALLERLTEGEGHYYSGGSLAFASPADIADMGADDAENDRAQINKEPGRHREARATLERVHRPDWDRLQAHKEIDHQSQHCCECPQVRQDESCRCCRNN